MNDDNGFYKKIEMKIILTIVHYTIETFDMSILLMSYT
jgi:hypothetical protein